MQSDYNNFYSTACNLGRYDSTSPSFQIFYPVDLAEWQSITGLDQNSLEVNPAFVNDTDLHSISSMLDGAGITTGRVTDDFDGQARSNPPDIGADEFTGGAGTYSAGTYSVPTDFGTIQAAIDSFSKRGINGNIILNIASGTYTEQVEIKDIPRSSPADSIIIQSSTQDSSDVVIQYSSTASDSNWTVLLDKAEGVTLQHLTIRANGNTYSNALALATKVERINIQNNIIEGQDLNSAQRDDAVIYGNGLSATDLKIMHNLIREGSFGIDLRFTNNTNCATSTSTFIAYNVFRSNYSNGMYIQDVFFLSVIENDITSDDEYTAYHGIYLWDNDSALMVLGNYVYDVKNLAMRIEHTENSAGNRGLVANNFLHSRDNGNGAYFNSNDYVDIFHNSVHKSNNTSTSQYAIQMQNSDNNRVWNNIFANSGGGPAVYYHRNVNLISDYNAFYSTTCNLGRFALPVSPFTNFFPDDLAEWQSVTGLDANSYEVNPAFLNDTDLHSISAVLDGAGITTGRVTHDFDMQSRGNPPDIGADEFTAGGSALSGTYSIPTDFGTFQAAIDSLVARGINGNVIINVANGTYTEQVIVPNISKTNPGDSVIFQSSSGVRTLVILQYASLVTDSNYTVKLKGAESITFQNLTLKALGTTYGRVLEIESYIRNVNLINNEIIGDSSNSTSTNKALIFGNPVYTDDFTVSMNAFTDGSEAIHLISNTSACANESPIHVHDNNLTDQFSRGVFLQRFDFAKVCENDITTAGNHSTFEGIYLHTCDSAIEVTKNNVNGGRGTALRLWDCDASSGKEGKIYNNMLQTHTNGSTVDIQHCSYQNFYHNSVHLSNSSNSNIYAAIIWHQGPIRVVNNIFSNSGGGPTVYFTNGTNIDTSDHNDFYWTGSTFGRWFNTVVNSFGAWQTTSGQDANSDTLDPRFVSTTDLHLTDSSLANIGMDLLAEVPEDIDEDPRTTTPFVGADEYTGACPGIFTNINWQNPSCNGGNDGYAIVTVTGGATPYTYDWSNNDTTDSIGSLSAGLYVVTVTDNNNCEVRDSVILSNPPAINLSVSTTPVSCNGGNDGSAYVSNLTGGMAPYSYLWSSNETVDSIFGKTAGGYSLTVTDSNGCQETENFNITQPSPLSVFFSPVVGVNCSGDSTGSARALVSGGNGGYSYSWSNGDLTQTADSLAAGYHTVTVTDSKGCMVVDSVLINQQPPITINFNSSNAQCNNDSTGSATAFVSGGQSPYSYSWSNGDMTQTADSLPAGTHYVTVTDVNGCTGNDSVTITQPSALTTSIPHNDVNCNGDSTGSAMVNVFGGTSPFSYNWSNGETTAAIDSLAAGIYYVQVTDDNGCMGSDSVIINERPALVLNLDSTDVTCNGAADGTATVSVSGGTPGYSYAWSNGDITATADSLPAGIYQVVVTDFFGCIDSASIQVNEPAALTISINNTDLLCHGDSTATATASVNGGTPPYSYQWSNGDATATADSLPAGMHYLTVTDSNGCQVMDSVEITQPSLLSLGQNHTDVSTSGGNDGSIDLSVSGGTFPYTYLWSNNANTQDINNLTAGQYCVLVTDDNGCQDSLCVIINEPGCAGFSVTVDSTDVSCNGGDDGTATAVVTGGASPYSYNWSNGDTGIMADTLSAGAYSLTVVDNNNCSTSTNFVINEPSELLVTVNGTDVLCNGDNTGTATANVSGGTTPYSYSWSNGDTTSTADSLDAGMHYVTITDSNGCMTLDSVEITEPPALSVSTSGTDVLCNGNNSGTATANVTGGTGPYNYEWSNGDTGSTADSLAAGIHYVTVTDDNGCMILDSVEILEPPALSVSTSGTDVLCNGDNTGSATATPSGGTMPYAYNWSNGDMTPTADSLAAGWHYVTVTDSNGCMVTDSVEITEPAVLDLTHNRTDVSTNGGSDGSIDLTVLGGTSPYSYLWSNSDTTQDISGLTAGQYCVVVTDDNGCIDSVCVNITEPAPGCPSLGLSTVDTDVLCNGGNTGSSTVSTSGGTAPFTYQWSNGDTGTTADSLSAGAYSVIVTDDNGCVDTATVNISEPALLTVSVSGTDVLCNGDNTGSATATPSGGTTPYEYSWNNGDMTATADSLAAGWHYVTVTDSNGCIVTDSVEITEPALLTVTTSVDNHVSCNGESNGMATASASGGTMPYEFSWSNGDMTATADSLPAGWHYVMVTDSNGCMVTDSVEITEPAVLDLTHSSTNVSTNGGSDGSIDLTVTGGTSPYSYLWSNSATSQDISGLTAGQYCVVVTDDNGCIDSVCVIITEPAPGCPSLGLSTIDNDVLCNGGNTGSSTVSTSGGAAPFSYQWSNGDTGTIADSLSAGAYTVIVTDSNGCADTATVNISEPTLLTMSVSGTDVLCNGDNTGSATTTPSGGTTPYAYNWSNGDMTATADSLAAGWHYVTVTDSNGCMVTDSVEITEPAILSVSISGVGHVLCNGENTGAATANASGGTTPYSYSWSNGDKTATADSLAAGWHYVTVTDSNGCMVTDSVEITEPALLTVSVSVDNHVSCNGGSNGMATASASGGSNPYEYIWSNGDMTATADSLPAGWHYVTIMDDNGCTLLDSVEISEPTPIEITGNVTDESSSGASDGAINITVTGGTAPYAFAWSNSDTTEDISGLSSGNYWVVVTDDNGCQDSAEFDVFVGAVVPVVKVTPSDSIGSGRAGYSTAIRGDWAIAGAPLDTTYGPKSGAAYIYQKVGGAWTSHDKLTSTSNQSGDKFGFAVDIYDTLAIIGAPEENSLGFGTGVAYVFARRSGSWVELQTLTAPTIKRGDFYGYDVAIFGERIAIGSFGADLSGYTQSGAVYIYERSAGTWAHTETLLPNDVNHNDYTGLSVDMYEDRVVAGSPTKNSGLLLKAGAAYVWKYDGAGNWAQEGKLVSGDLDTRDSFGISVAVVDSTVIVGAYGNDDDGNNSGSAYIFQKGASTYAQTGKLTASDGDATHLFGHSVGITNDTAIVGAYADDHSGIRSGSAYLFANSGGWGQFKKLVAPTPGAYEDYGFSVDASEDWAMVGAKGDGEVAALAGAVYFYHLPSVPTPILVHRETNLFDEDGEDAGNDEESAISAFDIAEEEAFERMFDQITVYPNPARDRHDINISIPEGKEAQVQIIDAAGNFVVNRFEYGPMKIHNLRAGVYFLRIQIDAHVVHRKIVVVK
ncbi:MAG: T9SS type A sorting domain-containing protein [Bacteroidia bacterium]